MADELRLLGRRTKPTSLANQTNNPREPNEDPEQTKLPMRVNQANNAGKAAYFIGVVNRVLNPLLPVRQQV